jgi:hypothetical protein
MYQLLRSISIEQLLFQQMAIFSVCVIIAELFYEFHSFTLNCIAFLATWYILDASVTCAISAGSKLGRSSYRDHRNCVRQHQITPQSK